MELHDLESGQAIFTHEAGECIGEWCVIHRPMPGPWESWPRVWRGDRGIVERRCPHGVGHPVAEMHEWSIMMGQEVDLIHGCDGCPCSPSAKEKQWS